MAGWLKGRTKMANLLGILKDQTAAGLARASGSFSHMQFATVMATNHNESLPEEKYVEEILAAASGSRLQVSYCTRAIVKRLTKTQSWAVAIKCLIIVHRSILDGGFLFQDQLAYSSFREGRDYLNFLNFRDDQKSDEWELANWVKLYAKYLDERLNCARVLKSHFDNRWTGEKVRRSMEFLGSDELLQQLGALQELLHELFQCQPGAEAGEHPVIQGALVLVVTDSYKVHDEIRYRIQELLERVETLQLSESFSLLQLCKRDDRQMQSLQTFLESCRELSLLSDIPLPEKVAVSESEIRKLTEAIQTPTRTPSAPLPVRNSTSSTGRLSTGGVPLESRANASSKREEQGTLQRTSSQPMSQSRRLPGVNGARIRDSFYSTDFQNSINLSSYGSADLIDLSFDSDPPSVDKGLKVSIPRPHVMRDLITFSPHEWTT